MNPHLHSCIKSKGQLNKWCDSGGWRGVTDTTVEAMMHLNDEVALEAPFFGKNVQSMLKLGRAQGVAMAAALAHGIPINEYAPKKVKQSVTGNGNASKEQVAAMIQNLLKFQKTDYLLDATDALAVALCHHFQGNKHSKKTQGWSAFLSDHPKRIKS